MLETLQKTLLSFANNPSQTWGVPTDGSGAPTGISTGIEARVTVQQADRNTARLNSGTYTQEQYDNFNLQLAQVERTGSRAARFPGDPDGLPESMSEYTCSCGERFRTCLIEPHVRRYQCNLDRLCPVLPGRHIRAYWRRGDGWKMEVHGDVGFRNEMTFWWSNDNSGGNASHQGLTVHRDDKGVIRKLVFSTVASNANRCYVVTFNVAAYSTVTCAYYNSRSLVNDSFVKPVAVQEFDPLVVDLIIAMLPSWMLFAHRPRNPANGCFA